MYKKIKTARKNMGKVRKVYKKTTKKIKKYPSNVVKNIVGRKK